MAVFPTLSYTEHLAWITYFYFIYFVHKAIWIYRYSSQLDSLLENKVKLSFQMFHFISKLSEQQALKLCDSCHREQICPNTEAPIDQIHGCFDLYWGQIDLVNIC